MEYREYVSKQIDMWNFHILCQSQGNDLYFTCGSQKEDDANLKYWQQEMRDLIAAGVM